MIAQDIQNGHGVFFLDPHGDAINTLLACPGLPRLKTDLLLLDPQDPTHSFGINLFACRDVTNWQERHNTFQKAYEVFRKLWEREWNERPWLTLVSQYLIYAFLENPEYTFSDVPRFFLDREFRDQLVENITHHIRAKNYWRYSFQKLQGEATEGRIDRLLGDAYVEHIVSQRKTTIDFTEIMQERKIVFVRLPPNFPADINRFLGTLLINELIYASRGRESLPPDKRHQFCIYVDEFQHFASFQDFATLFTQARKLEVATTIAHQERYGQFGENRAILGATDASVNKVFFQLTVRDAGEQAPEFAKPAPTEVKRERELVLSEEPFPILLAGHVNPEINRFARTYLRPIKERQGDLEAERALLTIKRSLALSQADLNRINAQIEGIYLGHGFAQEQALERAKEEVLTAKYQTERLKDSWQQSRVTRDTIRTLNRIIVALEEGDVKPLPGDDNFAKFLIECARHSTSVPWKYVPILTLYISLVWGDPHETRIIPFSFANARGLFTEEVARLTTHAERETTRLREEVRQRFLESRWKEFTWRKGQERKRCEDEQDRKRTKVTELFRDWRLTRTKALWSGPIIYTNFVWLMAYRDIWDALYPYRTRSFAKRWRPLLTDSGSGYTTNINHVIGEVRDALLPQRYHEVHYHRFLSPTVVSDLLAFLEEYREGAFLTLALIDACRMGSWRRDRVYLQSSTSDLYPNLCLFDLPTVAEEDGLSTLRLLLSLNERMRDKLKNEDEFYHTILTYFRVDSFYYRSVPETDSPPRLFFKEAPRVVFQKDTCLSELGEAGFPIFDVVRFTLDSGETREEVRTLKDTLIPGHPPLSLKHSSLGVHWSQSFASYRSLFLDKLTRDYLLTRACDLVRFGEQIANITFPEPSIPDARELTSAYSCLLEDREKREWEEKMRNAAQAALPSIEQACSEKLAGLTIDPPEQFPVQIDTDSERRALCEECLEELYEGETSAWNPRKTLQVIEDFARFCFLLSHPENHIRVPSGQYTERVVPSRTVRDMTDEMAQELTSLPRYTAYAKVIEEREGRQLTLKRQIATLPPLPTDDTLRFQIEEEARDRTRRFHCTERTLIVEEIKQAQLAWQQAEDTRAARRRTRSGRRPDASRSANPEDTPPGRD